MRKWIKWKRNIEDGTNLLYQGLTTLANLQTLGEEYTGIIHWTSERRLPTKYSQIFMILFNCFGERVVLHVIGRFEEMLVQLPSDSELRPEARHALLLFCSYFKKFLPFLVKLHQTIFYFQGRYHDISKRMTGIQYVSYFWVFFFFTKKKKLSGTGAVLVKRSFRRRYIPNFRGDFCCTFALDWVCVAEK